MSTRLVGFGLVAAVVVVAPVSCGLNAVEAGTIKDLVDNDGGVIKVGPLTFTFTDTSVSGNRDASQVSVAAVDSNGLEFTIGNDADGKAFRLDSNADGVAKDLGIDIKYTVTSTVPINIAGLADNAFAQFKANGAFSQVTETLSNGSTLFVGSGDTNQANVPTIAFPEGMAFDVDNEGKLHTPPRGAGPNQDEAQLMFITNTFSPVPEPSTLVIWSLIAGFFGAGGFRLRAVKSPE